jgi:tetratricopeptide (TPR) repeat protein
MRLGRVDQAIAEHQRVLSRFPNHAISHRSLAVAYRLRGDSERSAAERRRFLELWKNADSDLRESEEVSRLNPRRFSSSALVP